MTVYKFWNILSIKSVYILSQIYQNNLRAGYKKGGMVKKTEIAKVHKGEMVIPKHLVKYVSKTLKDKIKKGGGKI